MSPARYYRRGNYGRTVNQLARNARTWGSRAIRYPGAIANTAAALYSMYNGYRQTRQAISSKQRQQNRFDANRSITRTRNKKYTPKGGNSAWSSKSAGFFNTRKKVRHYGKKISIAKFGTYKTMETGGEVTGTDCLYIGHVTCPYKQVWEVVAAAMVKALALRAHVGVEDLNQAVTFGQINDSWEIRYRTNYDLTAQTTHAFTAGAGYTFRQIIDNWITFFTTIWNTQYVLEAIIFNGAAANPAGSVYINLRNASFHFYAKSTLKLQNRTVGQAGDEDSEDVDNVPIYGKSYFGFGTGTQYNSGTTSSVPFVASTITGVISKDATVDGLREPPLPQLFSGNVRSGKARLDPGHIRTSKLIFDRVYPLQRLVRMASGLPGTTTYHYSGMGVYRFFAFEKMIDIGVDEAILVAFEHNLHIGGALKYARNTYTNAEYEKI